MKNLYINAILFRMTLNEYLTKHNISQKDFAEKVGVTGGMVNQWLLEHRPIAIAKCVLIEKLTDGEVTRQELRPDDWQDNWPELVSAA